MNTLKREKKNIFKKAALLALTLVIMFTASISLSACDAGEIIGGETEDWGGYRKESFYLNTLCDITIYRIDVDKAAKTGSSDEIKAFDEEALRGEYDDIISACFKLISEYEKVLSKTVEGSDIDRINKSEGMPTMVEKETAEVIKKGLEFGELSNGLFDISIGRVSELWNFHGEGEDEATAPTEAELGKTTAHVDFRKVVLDEDSSYIKLRDSEMHLDLGGIAKGYIADRAADFLRERGVVSGVVNLGGNIVAIGGKALSESYGEDSSENMTAFNLGIVNPLSETRELLGILPASDVTIVTSGTYERYVEKDGIRYHHILNPATGMPVDTDLVQVSIIAEAGHSVDCDGLSTACLALGVDEGTALIERLNSTEKYGKIEAIFLDSSGNVSFTNPETAFTLSRKDY